jgi:hypothetical protein
LEGSLIKKLEADGKNYTLPTVAKEQTTKPFQRDLALLQGKHQPQTRADNLLQARCHPRWSITLMHVRHEALALFAT